MRMSISNRAGSDLEVNMLVRGLYATAISFPIFIDSLCALLSQCRTKAVLAQDNDVMHVLQKGRPSFFSSHSLKILSDNQAALNFCVYLFFFCLICNDSSPSATISSSVSCRYRLFLSII